jgi:23S rRNA pseudouridine2605 synthase
VPERLNRYLASAGVASRRGTEEHIRAGRVTVNGVVADLGTRVSAGDDVRLDGDPVVPSPQRTVLLHKPAGVVTTARDPHGRPTVVELVGAGARLFPVGRLDLETTGALLLTTDGDLAHRLMHPRHGVPKTYLAEVRGRPPHAAIERLRAGVELEDGPTAPAEVETVRPGLLRITIHEGRNRQVRRMCAAVGHPARSLHRERYAFLEVGDLAPGRWRDVTAEELEALRGA